MVRAVRVASAVILAAAGLAAATPAAAAATYRIGASSLGVYQIGDWRPQADPTLGGAIDAFGRPTSLARNGESCLVRWAPLGLTILFANFGAVNSCAAENGRIQTAWVSGAGSRVWYTGARDGGLRTGDTLGRLRALYPNETLHGTYWWLASKYFPIFRMRIAVLAAATYRGRVSTLRMVVGAAGD